MPPVARSRRSSRRPRSARPGDADADELASIDPSLLSERERIDWEARHAAEAKVRLYREAAKVGIPAFFLALIPALGPFLAGIVLIFGGMRLARRWYSLVVEPNLRRRLVEDEVEKRIQKSVQHERQVLEGEHARNLESLSASIAHEIRNPITAAKSLVQQMEEQPASQDNAEFARVALGELERVERSISHLLKYAREEELRLRPVRMDEVLDSALETFRERSARGGVEIRRSFDRAGSMEGDADKLRRVFINLVGNAIDALEEARVERPRVEVSMGENLAGTEVWVRVRDNGPGIDPEIASRIFDPFTTAKSDGTGLGLAITRKLVEAHEGEITLHSEPGEGSEFALSFPKRPEGEPE